MGRSAICPCGVVSFWQTGSDAVENSQQFAENTPWVIELMNNAANAAPDYDGDSMLNSLADTGFAMAGFWLARWRPGAWRSTSCNNRRASDQAFRRPPLQRLCLRC